MTEPGRKSIAELLAEGRAAWPDVALGEAELTEHLRRVADLAPETLGGLHAPELYLTCACALGEPRAIEAFDATYIHGLAPTLARVGADDETIEELKQLIRVHLLVAEAGQAPRIAEYGGRGNLHGWLRIVAVRLAIRFLRKARGGEVPMGDRALEARSPLADPALDHLKRRYQGEFDAALRGAFRALDERARNLLRHRYFDRLNVDEIGAIYGVHRTTAARWVAQAQQELLTATRAALVSRLNIDVEELDSILRLIASQIELTLTQMLDSEVSRAR